MDNQHYRQLVHRYLNNRASAEELEVFADLLKKGELQPYLRDALNAEAGISQLDEQAFEPHTVTRKLTPVWFKYAAAAAMLIFASVSTYLLLHPSAPKQFIVNQNKNNNDVSPGDNKAILTLADGKQMILTGRAKGVITTLHAAKVNQVSDGQIAYQTLNSRSVPIQQALIYNTVSTPRAGQYQVVLPDGTQVWLNAASSIRFPVEFSGTERRVYITGEVYMEVSKNKEKPFYVETGAQTIRVLGTHFNVNAYPDEQGITTTLLEGRIQISNGRSHQLLLPGNQVKLLHEKFSFEPASDTEGAVAWKNGFFKFYKTDLPTLTRQLARWYDIDVVYRGAIPQHKFVGEIKRKTNLSNVLRILETSGVKFKIDNKTLYIQQAPNKSVN
ncbi:FecR family protein [Mucilaginibacter terrae]|uniref:FecR family protein n=1 Tax=Mucilaginibacter terrae TaxID=1955052 RepID=UPI00363E58A7